MDRESRWWTIVNDILRSENPELFHDLKSNLFYWGKNTIAKFVTTLSNVIVNEISNTPTDLSINIATTTEEDTDLMERIGPAALASLAG
ncbi:hypothetical protein QE152_g13632 [Popillia japonica]|uniref:Uncharacterized protein n=1 Tax=Popillia japonica TaxID=7064 RepID=A0AAW1LCR7_POPJA